MRFGATLFAALTVFLLSSATGAAEGSVAAEVQAVTAPTRYFPQRPLRIGIITMTNAYFDKPAIRETVEQLKKVFHPYPVEARVMDTETLEAGIRDGSVDVFIASAGYYVRMRKYGVISVGTLISKAAPDPNHGTASVFLVRSHDAVSEGIQTLKNLQGKKLAASFPTAFIGYRTGMAEIAQLGFDPENFFSKVLFTDRADNDEIAGYLLRHETDAALVTACWLETLPQEKRALFRVLNPIRKGMDCVRSSRTYPGVTIGVTQGAAPGVAHLVAKTLLTMDKFPNGFHWGLATDMRSVDRLYRELKLENYAYLRDGSVKRWLIEHWHWVAMVLLGMLGLVWHSWRVGVLVRRRTAELTAVMEEKNRTQQQADELRERTERLQKATIVGQLSNMIAHELAQPLTALKNYCDGQKTLLQRKETDRALLQQSCARMEKVIERTAAIVEKVRSYNKGGMKRGSCVELEGVLRTTSSGIAPRLRSRVHMVLVGADHVTVRGDPLEIELLFANLLKNAVEAAVESEEALVRVDIRREAGTVHVVIENSGVEISEVQLVSMQTPFMTTKETGHGLGVSIAMALAEASGGHIEFRRRPAGGLIAEIVLVEF